MLLKRNCSLFFCTRTHTRTRTHAHAHACTRARMHTRRAMDEECMETEDSFTLEAHCSPPHPPPPSPYCSPGGAHMGGAPGGCGTTTGSASPAAAAAGLSEPAQGGEAARYVSPHSQQISMAEYNMQSHHYTQQALRQLKASQQYKQHSMKCKR